MSMFKLKPEKQKIILENNTLDEEHKKTMNEFHKRRELLPKKRQKLIKLMKDLETIENKDPLKIVDDDKKIKSKLKTDINKLEEEIKDIETCRSEIEYYSKTNEILMDYYDILEEKDEEIYEVHPEMSEAKNIYDNNSNNLDQLDILNIMNKKRKITKKPIKKRKKKILDENRSIMNFLVDDKKEIIKDISKDKLNNKINDRASLLEYYKMLTDHEYRSDKSNINPISRCSQCSKDKVVDIVNGTLVCMDCGEIEMIIIESDKPNYKDNSVPEKIAYPYKRKNHFNEWLSQFQAKESTDIPSDIYNQILTELHKNKFYNFDKLTLPYVKQILKKLNQTTYYEHSAHIISKLSGLPPPTINRDTEERLKLMFEQIQKPFEKHCPKERINFLSYSYVLHKFCELLELDDFLKCFPLLKSREKLRSQDKIWERICEELKWEFLPSI